MKDPKITRDNESLQGTDDTPKILDNFWNQALAKMTELPEYELEERDFSIPNV